MSSVMRRRGRTDCASALAAGLRPERSHASCELTRSEVFDALRSFRRIHLAHAMTDEEFADMARFAISMGMEVAVVKGIERLNSMLAEKLAAHVARIS